MHMYAVIHIQQYMRRGYYSRSREFHAALLKACGIKVVTDWRKSQRQLQEQRRYHAAWVSNGMLSVAGF